MSAPAPAPEAGAASTGAATADLDALLGTGHRRPWWRRGGPWAALLLLAALAAGAWWWQQRQKAAAAPRYVTAPVVRGNLALTVAATGTLQPTRSVAVGSELSGTVARVAVDVNDHVRQGQVLVELDTAKLRDAVDGARADLSSAQARRRQAEATLREARAALARLNELARLSGGRLPAATELDSARATAERASADLGAAAAAVAQSRTTLSARETDLRKASIRSPIDGVVLARNVEPGNAVAASLQAVTLLTLAEDLRQMVLSVNVDEADVGRVREGQEAHFTVAAQPGRSYPARVRRVAFGSKTTDNVVTYTTELDVDNADLTLRPGMTASATIAAAERRDVLLVPNAALRFTPPEATGTPATGGGPLAMLMPRPPRSLGGRRAGAGGNGSQATLWLLRDGQAVALPVRRGLSDGRQTEVSGEGLAAGQAVIVDQTTSGVAAP